ncbi:MAG: hypothetical protein ACI89T_002630 [Cognaticolwellia sp.]|jgi:hypothetical protein
MTRLYVINMLNSLALINSVNSLSLIDNQRHQFAIMKNASQELTDWRD